MKSTANKTIILLLLSTLISCHPNKFDITFSSLLDEMVSFDEAARYPAIAYTCHQESSYDRRSYHPDSAGWFANNDGFGFIRTDTIDGRKENVLMDDNGAGLITRFWLTTMDKRGTIRFYFNHAKEAQWSIPAYDLLRSGLNLGKGLAQAHPNYTPDGKGGNTLFLPIPYSSGCKITFELPDSVAPSPKYYGINYRKYPEGTSIETFSIAKVKKEWNKIQIVDSLLLAHPNYNKGKLIKKSKQLESVDSLTIALPKGSHAIRLLTIDITVDSSHYEQAMRELIISMKFDGTETVLAPLSDFSGAGMGSRKSESWYLSSDGKGHIASRWVMPYRENAVFSLINLSSYITTATVELRLDDWKWDERSLYFHTSWRQERGIHVDSNPNNDDACIDWNFSTIKGRGVYRGDVLSLFNHTLAWYGEGDEKIWVDNDTFPSHFGTGTEDYYNCSWAPVIPFYTPFGGATRADAETSIGYNTFFRTRNLDQIPFNKSLRFDVEMLSWISGTVDYAATVFWYGDLSTVSANSTPIQEASHILLAQPTDPATYKIAKDAIEFEKLTPTNKSSALIIDGQSMLSFSSGQWGGSKQALYLNGQIGSFVEYEFHVPQSHQTYDITIYGTKAPDYGVIGFTVNNIQSTITLDGCSAPKYDVVNTGAIHIGRFIPIDGKIHLRVELIGKNRAAHGTSNVFGLDCLTLQPAQ